MPETHYNLPVSDTLSTAWHKTYGAKGSIWLGILIAIVISIAFAIVGAIAKEAAPAIGNIVSFIAQVITYLLQMGLMYIGICKALDKPSPYSVMFRAFEWPILLRLIGLYIVQAIIFAVLAIIFIIPIAVANLLFLSIILGAIGILVGIYIIIRLSLASAFVLDEAAGPIEAIKLSWLGTCRNFWNILAIYILEMLILLVSLIPLGIGLIWSLPFAYLVYGTVYRNLLANNLPNKIVPVSPVTTSPT